MVDSKYAELKDKVEKTPSEAAFQQSYEEFHEIVDQITKSLGEAISKIGPMIEEHVKALREKRKKRNKNKMEKQNKKESSDYLAL